MLVIKTHLAPSEIHGLGLFTDEDIIKGQVIWEFYPIIDKSIDKRWFETLPPVVQESVRHYAWVDDGEYYLSLDNDRFMNHSDDPNIENDHDKFCIANRDIKAGKELTCDYQQYGTKYQKTRVFEK